MWEATSNQNQCQATWPSFKFAKWIARNWRKDILRHQNICWDTTIQGGTRTTSRLNLDTTCLPVEELSPMLAVNMKRLRPFLARVFDDRLTLTNTLIISVVSFSGSMLLHALYVDLPQMQKGYNRTHFLFDTSISTRDNSWLSGTLSPISNIERRERKRESNQTGNDNGTKQGESSCLHRAGIMHQLWCFEVSTRTSFNEWKYSAAERTLGRLIHLK